MQNSAGLKNLVVFKSFTPLLISLVSSVVGMNSQQPLENSIQYQKQTDISQNEGPGSLLISHFH